MIDRPIVFSAPMVKALLAGRKTQTRRILKPAPEPFLIDGAPVEVALEYGEGEPWPRIRLGNVITLQEVRYRPGMQLWVREGLTARPMANVLTGEPTNAIVAAYAADDEDVCEKAGFNLAPWWKNGEAKRRPLAAMHMPRTVSRLTLTVTDVRVQRLQDITEADALAEGITEANVVVGANCYAGVHVEETADRYFFDGGPDEGFEDGISAYAALWDRVHDAGAWEANPWVAAVSFTTSRSNIDAPADPDAATGCADDALPAATVQAARAWLDGRGTP